VSAGDGVERRAGLSTGDQPDQAQEGRAAHTTRQNGAQEGLASPRGVANVLEPQRTVFLMSLLKQKRISPQEVSAPTREGQQGCTNEGSDQQ
jgi:hypothetical protein